MSDGISQGYRAEREALVRAKEKFGKLSSEVLESQSDLLAADLDALEKVLVTLRQLKQKKADDLDEIYLVLRDRYMNEKKETQ